MKLETTDGYLNADRTIGFFKIKDKEKAQQVTIDTSVLMHIGRLCEVLDKLGFDTLVITVEDEQPLVIGGKDIGIALTARVEEY